MAGDIKGITIVLDGDATKLTKALQDVNKKGNDLYRQLREVDRALKFNPGNSELIAQKQRILGETVENTKKKIDQLKDAHKQASAQLERGELGKDEFDALTREIIKAEDQLKSYEKQLRYAKSASQEFGAILDKVSKKATDVGKNLSTKVTAPIVAVGALATKAASDYESAFAGVRKTTDATEEEFAMLSEGIREMSKELPASAANIAEVMEAAGQLGIEVPNLLDFTRVMIDLGESTNMSADEAATALARLANITGMSQGDFGKLGSVIVDLGNNFATTEKEIVAMGLNLAGAGAQVGMTEAEVMSFAAALSSVGIEAQAGGTAFSKVMVQMQLATERGGKELENFAKVAGMSAEEFSVAFKKDAAGAITEFIKGLSKSEEKGLSAIAVLDEMGISEVRLRDALLRASGASEVFTEAVQVGTNAWSENTALTNEAAQRYATFESQMAILKNQLTDLAITFGEHLMPYIQSFAEWLGNLAERFSALDEGTQKTILVVAGLAAAIGPLLIILGTLAGSISKIMGLFAAFSGPAGIIIMAIAAVIAAGVLLWQNWDTIKEKMQELKEFLLQTWENIKNFISSTFDAIKTAVINKWTEIKNAVVTKAQEIFSSIREKFNAIKESVSTIVDGVKAKISGVWESIRTTTRSVWDGIKNAITGPIESARDRIKAVIDAIKGFFNFKITWPKIPMPHFSIRPSGWKIGDLLKGSIPRLGISWYDQGGIFKSPAVIGVGEKRPEFVGALDDLRHLIGSELDKRQSPGIVIQNMTVRKESDIYEIARELHKLQTREARA